MVCCTCRHSDGGGRARVHQAGARGVAQAARALRRAHRLRRGRRARHRYTAASRVCSVTTTPALYKALKNISVCVMKNEIWRRISVCSGVAVTGAAWGGEGVRSTGSTTPASKDCWLLYSSHCSLCFCKFSLNTLLHVIATF